MIDPLHGDGYQLWSGIGGAVIFPLVWAAAVYLAPTRCTQLRCRRRAVEVTAAGAAFCRKHLPDEAVEPA